MQKPASSARSRQDLHDLHDGGGAGAAAAQALALALQALVVSRVASCRAAEPLLASRRHKPVPASSMGLGLLGSALGIILGIVGVARRGTAAWAGVLVALAWLGVLASVLSGGILVVAFAVDLELGKPPDAPMDSVLLYYLRCLCWTPRNRRAVLALGPIYLTAFAAIALTAAEWGDDTDEYLAAGSKSSQSGASMAGEILGPLSESECLRERRVYMCVASGLFVVYALVATAVVRCGWARRRAALAAVVIMALTSLAWGLGGSEAMRRSACQVAPEPAALHVLLVAFGAITLVLATVCNVEALLAGHEDYRLDPPSYYRMRNAGVGATSSDRLSRISEGDIDTEMDEEDDESAGMLFASANSTPRLPRGSRSSSAGERKP